ncbi:MAG: hypothetical protein HY719_12105, partial [Planctomycetes bacterium]|nr:hypothetical protein [Planctomycetota bacterium]
MDSLLSPQALVSLAAQVGTPFYLWSATTLRARFDLVATLVAAPGLSARYAMKACSTKRVLDEVRARGFWIDAVSGNEVLRAMRAGFPGGSAPPVVMLSADVFRDNALAVIRETGVLPNIGSPGQIDELAAAGLRGDIAMRL